MIANDLLNMIIKKVFKNLSPKRPKTEKTNLEVILWVDTEVVDFEVGFLALSFTLTFSDWLVVERVRLVLLFWLFVWLKQIIHWLSLDQIFSRMAIDSSDLIFAT